MNNIYSQVVSALHYSLSSDIWSVLPVVYLHRGSDSGLRLSQPWPAHLQWWKAHALRRGASGGPAVSATLRRLVVRRGPGGLRRRTPLLGGGGGRAGLAARCGQGIRGEAGLPLTHHRYRLPDPPSGEGRRSEGPDGAHHPVVTERGAQESRGVPGLWAWPAVFLRRGEALPPVHLQREVHRGTVPSVWDCGGGQRPGYKACRYQTAVPLPRALPLELNCLTHHQTLHSPDPQANHRVCAFILVRYLVSLNLVCCFWTKSWTLCAGFALWGQEHHHSALHFVLLCLHGDIQRLIVCIVQINILKLSSPNLKSSLVFSWMKMFYSHSNTHLSNTVFIEFRNPRKSLRRTVFFRLKSKH